QIPRSARDDNKRPADPSPEVGFVIPSRPQLQARTCEESAFFFTTADPLLEVGFVIPSRPQLQARTCEESAFFSQPQIPRCARDDNKDPQIPRCARDDNKDPQIPRCARDDNQRPAGPSLRSGWTSI